MPVNPDITIHCPLWHLLNQVDVSIANADDEKQSIIEDAESAKARGLSGDSLRSSYERKEAEIAAMQRVRAWLVECADRGELTLDNGIHPDMVQA